MIDLETPLRAPFPYFGGKSSIVPEVWTRLGRPTHYLEPFCGSAAMLLGAPRPASLEVVNDLNGFIANFWRAVVHQSDAVATAADYPVSHIDLGARHRWLMGERDRIGAALHDPHWPGDATVAGWWLWGQCAWIGSGWCDWFGQVPHVSDAGRGIQALGKVPHVGNAGRGIQALGQVPHVGNAGRGIQALGQVPHVSDAGRGIQALGQVPHVSDAGRGIQALGQVPHVSDAGRGEMWTSGGATARRWLRTLAARLERVRVVHGDWTRCLNHHYGGAETAVFLDPPYADYEGVYGSAACAAAVTEWARAHAHLRIALCAHRGDVTLPGWDVLGWDRGKFTYGGSGTTDQEVIYFSPACLSVGLPFGEPDALRV
jgi:hypothetical protein